VNFFIDLGFEKVEEMENQEFRDSWWEFLSLDSNMDGSICFFKRESCEHAKMQAFSMDAKVEKAGWLTKRGHQVKNWKKRWFLLKDPALTYFKSPRATSPAGNILLDDILAVVSEQNVFDSKVMDNPPFWFEIITKKTNYLICAENELELRDWIEAIEFSLVLREQRVLQNRELGLMLRSSTGSMRTQSMSQGSPPQAFKEEKIQAKKSSFFKEPPPDSFPVQIPSPQESILSISKSVEEIQQHIEDMLSFDETVPNDRKRLTTSAKIPKSKEFG